MVTRLENEIKDVVKSRHKSTYGTKFEFFPNITHSSMRKFIRSNHEFIWIQPNPNRSSNNLILDTYWEKYIKNSQMEEIFFEEVCYAYMKDGGKRYLIVLADNNLFLIPSRQ